MQNRIKWRKKDMLITRRSDYAMRIFRALQDEKVHNVKDDLHKRGYP